jgi:hypothetical protein
MLNNDNRVQIGVTDRYAGQFYPLAARWQLRPGSPPGSRPRNQLGDNRLRQPRGVTDLFDGEQPGTPGMRRLRVTVGSSTLWASASVVISREYKSMAPPGPGRDAKCGAQLAASGGLGGEHRGQCVDDVQVGAET